MNAEISCTCDHKDGSGVGSCSKGLETIGLRCAIARPDTAALVQNWLRYSISRGLCPTLSTPEAVVLQSCHSIHLATWLVTTCLRIGPPRNPINNINPQTQREWI